VTLAEHDIVVLTVDVAEHQLRRGDLGTIVHCYPDGACEVEFTTARGDTVAVVTLAPGTLRPASDHDVAAVRTA